MKNYTTLLLLVVSSVAYTQTQFISTGKVEYEKRLNIHKQLDEDGNNTWSQERKKVMPKIVIDFFTLSFNEEKSIYKLAKENTDNKYLWGSKPVETDVTIQDLKKNQIAVQREVFENTYLIKDSTKNYEWKISNETRTIAGFECKKAVTKICDSVYVVAFYTEQITPSVGPEGFSGLPGLILGLAIPRLYSTWFATKVELIEPTIEQLSAKIKGKPISFKGLEKELSKSIKDWGKEGARFMWTFLL